MRRPICAFAIIYAGLTAASAAGPMDGTYTGTGDSPRLECWGSSTTIVVNSNSVTWQATHSGIGAISTDGSFTIDSFSGNGTPVRISGSVSNGVITGVETQMKPNGCVWTFRLAKRALPMQTNPSVDGLVPAETDVVSGSNTKRRFYHHHHYKPSEPMDAMGNRD